MSTAYSSRFTASGPNGRSLLIGVAALLSVPFAAARAATVQIVDTARVSIIYTGKSLGALGVLRAQQEHELLTEQANAREVPFKLVSHPAWRLPGFAIFQTSEAPHGDELPEILAARDTIEQLDSVPALRSENVLIVQDPWREGANLLQWIEENPRTRVEFPDLRRTVVRMRRMRTHRDDRAMIVEEYGAEWAADSNKWHMGEMNRIDVGEDTRVFELPMNLGEIGPRHTVINALLADTVSTADLVILADLGERGGDLGATQENRAQLDYTTLRELGYSLSVPFEFELSLGAAGLRQVRDEFPGMAFLAANVRAEDSLLFTPHQVVQVEAVRIGLFGLVNPTVREQLPRSILDDFTFEDYQDAAQRAVKELRAAGAHVIVALSNLDPPDNAALAQGIVGIDVVVADLAEQWTIEPKRTVVTLLRRPLSRPESPALIAQGVANGVGVGRLDLAFAIDRDNGSVHLTSVAHETFPVTDRTPRDAQFLAQIAANTRVTKPDRGELMFPSFVELTDRHPRLQEYDATTKQGRVSKPMWEEFLARLLRLRGQAEVAIIRPLSHFPPLIGKLHENEIGAWLWTEDEIVLLDLSGADLRKIMLEDVSGELAVSGLDRSQWSILGRKLEDHVYYRVATTDVLYDGARFRDFGKARRVRRRFRVGQNGVIVASSDGRALTVKDFAFGELRRLRASARGDDYLDLMASLVAPDPQYVNLFFVAFDQPTLWLSLNQNYNSGGYGAVPESRVASSDSWVVGLSGRMQFSHEARAFATELGFAVAYARQSQTLPSGDKRTNESADNFEIDLTVRPRGARITGSHLRPFLRGVFDSEFSATTDPVTGEKNPHQRALRGVSGVLLLPQQHWRRLEAGAVLQTDIGQPGVEYGVQVRSDFHRPIGPAGRLVYRWRNDATYLFPSSRDTASDLALRYHMINELLFPLVDELSISLAADLFLYQGKVEATRRPGMSLLLRIGLTYDRLWKPRYQPLF
jgi:NAD(P)-dependent dehydrogenase (short-subunit alcohol dehydrogenase family)